MSKVTNKQRISALERQVEEMDKMLTELNHALPNPTDKPKLKTLDQSVFENSLIEREVELIGSDLTRAMLARGDRWVFVKPSDHNDKDALSNNDYPELVTEFDQEDFYCIGGRTVEFAVPINSVTGEPLTAQEAGL